jgi:hypothetical protein
LLTLLLGGYVLLKRPGGLENAAVGECVPQSALVQEDISKVDTVDCTADEASMKVVGIEPDRPMEELANDDTLCMTFPTAEAKLWVGERDKMGDVLCLEPLQR